MIPVLHGVWAAAGGLVGDFEHIETQTVGAGGAASITFSSIPGTYKHLQIRYVARTTTNTLTAVNVGMRINGITTSNYVYHSLYGDGAIASSFNNLTPTSWAGPFTANAAMTASIFGAGVIDILDYASTTKNKTFRVLTGVDVNGSGGYIGLNSGLQATTNAITSITFIDYSGNSLAQHSTFALYGVK